MNEFALIRAIIAELGQWSEAPWARVGPGDDAAVLTAQPDRELVASIDALVEGVHFPVDAPAALVGYRSLMVSVSDLAAMGADPRYSLMAVSAPAGEAAAQAWLIGLAQGIAEAASVVGIFVSGGNLASGPRTVSVSVHGDAPIGRAVTRAGAKPGDLLQVSGALGGAAACVRTGSFEVRDELTPLQQRYFRPRARVDLVEVVRASAHAAIDVSDGLLADLNHLVGASGCAAAVRSRDVPVHAGAELTDALYGGDDYELLIASPTPVPGFVAIGECLPGSGVTVDGALPAWSGDAMGYQHFGA